VNSGNPIAVLMECAGGAQQTAPATQSQHAVQMGQVAGVVGSTRNLAMSVTAASATATLTADEIIVETALGGVRYCLPSFSKTINLATTGAGGMDTGSAPVSGYVALYAIWNPTTATAALLAKNATAGVQTNVYSGANMPAGYTASALVGVWPTNGSGQFIIGTTLDRRFFSIGVTVLSVTSSQSSFASLSIASAVPPNARSYQGTVATSTTQTTSNTVSTAIACDVNGTGTQSVTSALTSTSGFQAWINTGDVPITAPQTTFWKNSASGGTPSSVIIIYAYTF
jgi:hypothetical protein